jgi:signal transduction histidine kinase
MHLPVPNLDIATLFVIMILSQVVNLLFSGLLALGGRSFPGAGWWLAGQFTVVVGVSATAFLRGPALEAYGVVAGNTVIMAGSVMLLDGVWRFRHGRRMPWPAWLSVPLFAAILAGMLGASFNLRVLVYSLFVGGTALASGMVLVYRVSGEQRLLSGLASLAFFLMVPVHVARAVVAAAAPPFADFYHQGDILPMLYLVTIFSCYLLLYGFFLLSGMRRELELRRSDQTNLFMMQVIAHDLRNPVHGASRYLERHVLASGVDPETKHAGLKVLGETLRASGLLLDNLLAWAEMRQDYEEAGRLEAQGLHGLLGPALVLVQEGIRERSLALELPDGDPVLLADRRMAASVLRNILSNAVRHSPAGGIIRVAAAVEESMLVVAIRDQGPGMDPEMVEKLSRGDCLPRLYGNAAEAGNSLGLILCHRFMALQGGSLGIESRLGEGSCFTLRFRRPS